MIPVYNGYVASVWRVIMLILIQSKFVLLRARDNNKLLYLVAIVLKGLLKYVFVLVGIEFNGNLIDKFYSYIWIGRAGI